MHTDVSWFDVFDLEQLLSDYRQVDSSDWLALESLLRYHLLDLAYQS